MLNRNHGRNRNRIASIQRQRFTQLIRQLYSKVITTPCILCHAQTSQQSLCQKCSTSLPLLGPACPRCANPLPKTHICGSCLTHPAIRHRSQSLFQYAFPIDKLISEFKFNQRHYLSQYLGHQLAHHIKQVSEEMPQMLIPIPLHHTRLKQRGYNQSAELAKVLSTELDIPLNQSALKRIKATKPQNQLPFSERKKNLMTAFTCQANHQLPEHIALIDDVLTTGHTADAAAKALIKQGVKTVELWTIARTIRDHG